MVTVGGEDGLAVFCYMLQPALQIATTSIPSGYNRRRGLLHPHNDVLIFATISIMLCYKHTAKCYNRQRYWYKMEGRAMKMLQWWMENATTSYTN